MTKAFYQFVLHEPYKKSCKRLGCDDDRSQQAIESEILRGPELGSPLAGGIRKLRVGLPHKSKGKSGSYRVIYYFFSEDEEVHLLHLLDKSDVESLTSTEMLALQKALTKRP